MSSKKAITDTTGLDLEHITALAVAECRRQQVGLDRVGFLLEAYCYALASPSRMPSLEDVLILAKTLEPSNGGRVRTTPVAFSSGGGSASPDAIPHTLDLMFSLLDEDVDAQEFTRQFLWVHPFTDGNGRTGWILYNWITGRLEKPEVLPRFEW